MSEQVGNITWISGPVVRARGSRHVGMLELVEVGDERLVGEVIGLRGDIITVQVYEETSGMQTGAPIYGTGLPLSVELGPGLIQSISQTTQAQTDVAKKVAQNMQDIQSITNQTTDGTKRTAVSIGQLANLAADLKGSVAGFKL